MSEPVLTDEQKRTFREAGERRLANGIRLKQVRFMADANQVQSFNAIWESWLDRWGKQAAVDHLIRLMGTVESRLRDKERAK